MGATRAAVVRWVAGKERGPDAFRSTAVLYADGALTCNEENLSMELRGKRLGLSFDFVHKVVANEVYLEGRSFGENLERHSSVIKCDPLINCLAVGLAENSKSKGQSYCKQYFSAA